MLELDGQVIDTRPVFIRNSEADEARMVAPGGSVCYIPRHNVTEAEKQGFRLLTSDLLERMHNRLFLVQKFFEEKHPKITSWKLPRGIGKR